MSTLNKAIALAASNHEGQTDKGGNPYILHPIRVMLKCMSEEQKIAGILHDIVEDTEITLNDLRLSGFSEDIVIAIDCLTRRNKESYDDFILRAKSNPIARIVKIYDIEDNKDLTRIKEVTNKDFERLKKYDRALKILCS